MVTEHTLLSAEYYLITNSRSVHSWILHYASDMYSDLYVLY